MGNCCSIKKEDIIDHHLDQPSNHDHRHIIDIGIDHPININIDIDHPEDISNVISEELGKMVIDILPISESINYHIALKSPKNTKYMYTKQDDWNFSDDINEWISDRFSSINYKSWIVYNNQLDKDHSSFAHAKGIIVWNNTKICWMIHSVPNFPESFNENGISKINKSELVYGQSFIFIDNIPINNLKNIKDQLSIMHVHVYNQKIFDQNVFDQNVFMKNNVNIQYHSFSNNIHHVSKSKHFGLDLYEGHLVDKFGGSCYTETWIRGHEIPETDRVSNIKEIKWKNGNTYTYAHDHSKYAVSNSNCIVI